jgi:dihydrolipoamide dehydrogenase
VFDTAAHGRTGETMSLETHDYDLVVIGSGPGGYVAALRGAQRGLKTALIERSDLGGVCLNWGCIPTKALLRSAHLYQEIQGARRLGLQVGETGFDYPAIVRRSRQVVERLVKAVRLLLERDGVDLHVASAVLDGREGDRVRVRLEPVAGEASAEALRVPRVLRARSVILATGGRSRALPGAPFDGERVLSSREALALTEVPRRLLIVGAGAIGVEFADLFATFGSQVTVVEMLPNVLPGMDAELGEELRKLLIRRKVKVRTGARVEAIDHSAEGLRCRVRPVDPPASAPAGEVRASAAAEPAEIEADRILVAIGVAGNVEGIGLESLGLQARGGFVPVDEHMRTGAAGVYAIGDLTGPPLLAHAASAHGIHAADHAAFTLGAARAGNGAVRDAAAHAITAAPEPIAREWIPGVVYTHPQIASVGLDEATARARHGEVEVGRFHFVGLGRAVAENEPGGFVKVILERGGGRLLGGHIVGPVAGELIAELTLAGRCGLPARAVLATIHAHPTYAEGVYEAFGAALGEGIHG